MRRVVGASLAQLGHELLESLDRAAPADARVNRVTVRAKPLVLRLEVEPAVEVERGTFLVELRPYSRSVGKDEVDLIRTRQHGSADCAGRYALRALALDPLDFAKQGLGLDRHAQDDFILDDQPRDRLAEAARLRTEQAEQQRHQRPHRSRNHQAPVPMPSGFAAKR